MKRCCLCCSLIICQAALAAVIAATAAHADNPSWAEQQARNAEMQRQALQQQAQRGPSPQVQQYERWKQEWIQQHPNEPIPSMGVLEHLHSAETIANTNAGFAKMRAERQAQLQRDYQVAKQRQEQTLAAQHITWSAQQWQNWDREYNAQMKLRADQYLEMVRQVGAMDREEQRRKALGF